MMLHNYKCIFSATRYIALLMAFFAAFTAGATGADTANVFSLKDLEELVLPNHPIMRQAGLLSAAARARVGQSLGKFDPLLKTSFDRKDFGNTEYYNNWHSELKVPLWVAGADLKAGFDRNVGTYVNPETRTGDDGLTGVGITVPLGQGLLIDERRSVLRQAQQMVRYAEAEQVKQIITVWYDVVKTYWDWYYAYSQYQLLQEGVALAETRYVAVSNQTLIGDKPGIDSVEAAITVQDRQIQLAKLEVELQNARLLLSNHLWSPEGQPLELPAHAVPPGNIVQNMSRPGQGHLDSLIALAAAQHPELEKLHSKSAQLDVERRYRVEMLKPKLNISGSLLTSRNTFGSYYPEYYDLNWGNYKVGVDFAIPLFLRYERGKLKEVKLKQQEVTYDLQQTDREIRNNILTSYNLLKAYENQLLLQVNSINNQQQLLTAELQKFDLGESTLFVINSRETKLIDMKMKRAEMITGFQKKLAELYYKAGVRVGM